MTRTGVVALVLAVPLIVAGWLLAWPALFVMGVAVIVLVVVAVGYILRRPRLSVERQIHPPRVPKGSPAIAYLHLTNRSRFTLPATTAVQPYGRAEVKTLLPRLLGGQSGIRTYRLPTVRRGVFPIGPVEISRGDPFGFARLTIRFTGNDEIWVYPKLYPLRSLASGLTRHLEGPTSDLAQEGSITFHRLREYVVGDDLRMIHWKSTAKTGRMVIRHNVDTSQPFTVVLLDVRPEVYSSDTFETAVDVAASAINSSCTGQSPVQLRMTSGHVEGGPHTRDPGRILDYLTRVSPDANGDIRQQLLALRRERGGTALVIVTGVLDHTELPACASLRRRYERVIVVSIDPDHPAPVRHPGVRVITARRGEEFAAAWNLEVSR